MALGRTRLLARVSELPLWLFALWATSMVVRAHWPYLAQPSEQNVDEGYLLAIGQRMLHGRMLPFVDGVAHSGPLFLFTGALIAAFGEFSWLPIRVASVLAFASTAALSFACGRRAGRPLAGAIAAAAIPLYVTLRMSAIDAIAYNAELPAVVCLLASFYASLRALPGPDDDARPVSRTWLIAAGVLATCCVLSKQVATLLVLPLVGYVVASVLVRDELSTRQRRRMLLTYAGAAALPALALLVPYVATGTLKDLVYYVATYNAGPYMFPFRKVSRYGAYKDWLAAHPIAVMLGALGVGWGLLRLLAVRVDERSWGRAFQRSGFELMVALWAIGGVIGARASMRYFDHYEILAVPGFGLLLGSLIERETWRRPEAPGLALAYRALLLVPLVLASELVWARRAPRLTGWSAQHLHETDLATAAQEPPVCAFIREHSKPSDRLFVWGFHAQLHVTCARLPASRFVFSSFVSGYVPWSADSPTELEDTLVVPGSRDLLIQELEATKPPVIVDAGRTLAYRSFRRYEQLFHYVEQNYRLFGVVGGDEVWLRKP